MEMILCVVIYILINKIYFNYNNNLLYLNMQLYEPGKDLESYDHLPEFQNFDFYSLCFPKEEFPEMHKQFEKQPEPVDIVEDITEEDDVEMEEITEQMENLTIDLNKYKVVELKKIAKKNGLKKYSKLKKKDLIELLNGLENLKL